MEITEVGSEALKDSEKVRNCRKNRLVMSPVPVSQEILQLGNFAAAALFPRKLCS